MFTLPRSLRSTSSLMINGSRLITKDIRPSTQFSLFSTSSIKHRPSTEDITAVSSSTYQAPLKKTVRNIKLFSLSSLFVSTLISPVFFIIESEIDFAVRGVMVGIALATSAFSTGVIQWVLKPYCIDGTTLSDSKFALERLTWLGRRKTTVVEAGNLKVEKNGRMFSNLTTVDGKDQFYVHETTRFWRELTKDAKISENVKEL